MKHQERPADDTVHRLFPSQRDQREFLFFLNHHKRFSKFVASFLSPRCLQKKAKKDLIKSHLHRMRAADVINLLERDNVKGMTECINTTSSKSAHFDHPERKISGDFIISRLINDPIVIELTKKDKVRS